MSWPHFRKRQLWKLRLLLIEVQTLDHGSGVTDRIRRCESLARALESDIKSGRDSFWNFLVQECNDPAAKKGAGR